MPTIMVRKYQNMKYNLNNEIKSKSIYQSMTESNKIACFVHYSCELYWHLFDVLLREICNSEKYSRLVNKWEKWEATDKSKKNVLRTIWVNEEEVETRKKRIEVDSPKERNGGKK